MPVADIALLNSEEYEDRLKAWRTSKEPRLAWQLLLSRAALGDNDPSTPALIRDAPVEQLWSDSIPAMILEAPAHQVAMVLDDICWDSHYQREVSTWPFMLLH